MLDPFQLLLIAVAGSMNRNQQQTMEYLREENRVLREQLGDRRLHFNNDQRCRLAARAKGMGRKLLAEVATLVTPDPQDLRQLVATILPKGRPVCTTWAFFIIPKHSRWKHLEQRTGQQQGRHNACHVLSCPQEVCRVC